MDTIPSGLVKLGIWVASRGACGCLLGLSLLMRESVFEPLGKSGMGS
jgi:hypothetical protein